MLVSRVISPITKSFDLCEYFVCAGRSNERLWRFAMIAQVCMNCVFQILNAPEGSTSDPLLRDLGEKPFDHVQPGSAGRREVKMPVRALCQPPLHLRRFMRPVIVHDQMDRQARLHRLLHLLQKTQELLMPVPAVTFTNHFTGPDVQRREQRRRPVTDIIVRVALRLIVSSIVKQLL